MTVKRSAQRAAGCGKTALSRPNHGFLRMLFLGFLREEREPLAPFRNKIKVYEYQIKTANALLRVRASLFFYRREPSSELCGRGSLRPERIRSVRGTLDGSNAA